MLENFAFELEWRERVGLRVEQVEVEFVGDGAQAAF